jgi:hypothetical protein
LHYAAQGGNIDIFRTVIDNGVDVNIKEKVCKLHVPVYITTFIGEYIGRKNSNPLRCSGWSC